MVYAAWRRKLPAALTEADAHLGLANRLAAPFARRVFLAYGDPGPRRREVPRHRAGRCRRAHRGVSQAEGRRRFGLPADGPVLAFFGALAGARSLNEFAVETYGDSGPAVLHVSGERDYERLRARVQPGRLRARRRRPTSSAPRSPPPTSRSRARAARSGSSPPPGTPADPRAVPARDGRPPDAERAPLRARRRRVVVPEAELDRVPALVDGAARRPGAARRRCARRCCRWRGRRRRRRSRRS